MPTFAERLKELRQQAGLSQESLAERSELHRQAIAKLELGLREPAWATVQALAKALGVSCEAFQTDGAEEKQPAKKEPAKKRSRPRKE